MHFMTPQEFDNRLNIRNRLLWIFFAGGTVFWTLFWVHKYGLGNFLPIKIGNLDENTLEENLSALLYGLSLILAVILFVTTRELRLRFGLFALYLLLMLGEEIDWGQVYFHFSTPDFFMRFNKAGVTNIHNLKTIGPLFAVVFLIFPIIAFVFFHYKKWKREKVVLSAVICWAFVAALVSELFPDRTIFNFMVAWMTFSYMILMAHIRMIQRYGKS